MYLLFGNCCNPSLGLATKARIRKSVGQERSSGMWESENEHSHSRWSPKTLESDCKRQKTLPWRVFYIIGKILKCRCPKWARMTHLDIFNISYGQKKGRESNWQFDSRPWKVGNRPDSFVCRWRVACRWKAFDKGYNFGLDLIPIGGLHKKL
jgi:hypothetical protein